MKEVNIIFYGIDDWNRPVFREAQEKDGEIEFGNLFFGDTDNLFNFDEDAEAVIEHYKKGIESLCYFGKAFNCEPYGLPPDEMNIKLIFDVELTEKILKKIKLKKKDF